MTSLTLHHVRTFKTEPTVKKIDAATDQERIDFQNYVTQALGESAYTVGTDGTRNGDPVIWYFVSDAFKLHNLMMMNYVTLDDAAVSNGSWHYCYLMNPSIKTTKSINLIIFHGQRYTITNDGSSTITVYVRHYDQNEKHHVHTPVQIKPGMRSEI